MALELRSRKRAGTELSINQRRVDMSQGWFYAAFCKTTGLTENAWGLSVDQGSGLPTRLNKDIGCQMKWRSYKFSSNLAKVDLQTNFYYEEHRKERICKVLNYCRVNVATSPHLRDHTQARDEEKIHRYIKRSNSPPDIVTSLENRSLPSSSGLNWPPTAEEIIQLEMEFFCPAKEENIGIDRRILVLVDDVQNEKRVGNSNRGELGNKDCYSIGQLQRESGTLVQRGEKE